MHLHNQYKNSIFKPSRLVYRDLKKQKNDISDLKKSIAMDYFQEGVKGIQLNLAKNSIGGDFITNLARAYSVFNILEMHKNEKQKSILEELSKKIEVKLKRKLKLFTRRMLLFDYDNFAKNKNKVQMLQTMMIVKKILEIMGLEYKTEEILFREFQVYFDAILSHITKLAKKEYKRIDRTGDKEALHELLIFLKLGNNFESNYCSSKIWKEYSMLREKVIAYTARLPLSYITKRVKGIKDSLRLKRSIMTERLKKQIIKIPGVRKVGKKYYITIDQNEWELSEIFFKNENRTMNDVDVAFSLKGREHEVHTVINFPSLIKKGRLNLTYIKPRLKQAFKDYAQQEKNKGILKKFDLPRNKAIGYISLFQKKRNYTIDKEQELAIFMPKILKRKYQLDLSAMKGAPFIETNNPQKLLSLKLAQLYKKGIRHFYLDLHGHGNKNGILIGKTLSGQNLVQLIKKYPDCTFTITSTACHGGGFRKSIMQFLKKNPKYAKKINLFLQSNPEIATHPASAVLAGPKNTYSTYYNVFFAHFLLQGFTFGEAAYAADIETQRLIPDNAEAVVDGKLISKLIDAKTLNRVV